MEQLCAEHDHHRMLLALSLFSSVVLCGLFGIVLHLAMVGETMHEFMRRLRGRKPKKAVPGGLDVPLMEMRAFGGVESGTSSNQSAGHASSSWRSNMEFLFGPMAGWWRWLIPIAPLHRAARKVS